MQVHLYLDFFLATTVHVLPLSCDFNTIFFSLDYFIERTLYDIHNIQNMYYSTIYVTGKVVNSRLLVNFYADFQLQGGGINLLTQHCSKDHCTMDWEA